MADQDQLICIRYVLKTNYSVLYIILIILIDSKYNQSTILNFSWDIFFINLEENVDIAEFAGQRLTTVILRRVAICLAQRVRVECTFVLTVDNILYKAVQF